MESNKFVSCSLLTELIIDILYRVPVKSLIRFKSVSKTWKSLVEDPDFVKSYMDRQKVKNKQLIVQCDLKGRFLSVDLDSLDKSRIVNLPMVRRSYRRIKMIGSFNGLVTFCCTFSDVNDPSDLNDPIVDDFIICNMATGEHVIIPLELPRPQYAPLAEGFGYDGVGDDYKIVRAFKSRPGPGADLITIVYSLKKHEWVWSTINSPGYLFDEPPVGSLVNGALHWLAYADLTWGPIIVAFDLTTEDYHKVPRPILMADDRLPVMEGDREFLELAVLGDSLCVVVFGGYGTGNVDIWLMKDYTVERSWIKVYSLRLKFFVMPLGFSTSGNDTALLLLEYKNFEKRVYWYNPSLKEEVQKLQIFWTPSSKFITAMVYEESPTLIVGSNGTRGKPTVKKKKRQMSNGCF